MNFADTNWLVSAYIEPHADDAEAVRRGEIVERFMRRHGGQLVISHVVLLEARNIFSRVTEEREPREWQMLEADFDGRLYVDPMNWDLLRRECNHLFSKYAWKAAVGTFDTAIVASAKLAGGTRFLSFDATARAMATAEGIEVFPSLEAAEKQLLARMKHTR
ncbi:MAG: PIN domain-containing protein [Verrucomicrobia bacterium]|nr:PIN domain-containing protein [Verrucomicrobiota bacterium]